jgi:TonB family protein
MGRVRPFVTVREFSSLTTCYAAPTGEAWLEADETDRNAMLRIERAVVFANLRFKSDGAITLLGLALIATLSSLAGCAQAPVAQAGAVTSGSTAIASTTTPAHKNVTCARPEYPKDARRRGSQGTTTVRFLIDTDGSVAQSFILKSSGDLSLDEAARSALSKCRFKPAVKDGQPQRAWAPVQYVWSLGPTGSSRMPPTVAVQP